MKNTTRSFHTLLTTLAALLTPAAFGMNYMAPNQGAPVLVVPTITLQQNNNFSGCSSSSNTIAVGYQFYSGGYQILCADAGAIGFWTTPVLGPLVGSHTDDGQRFLCPSGSALAGLEYIEGLIYPFPLCGELIPDFQSGTVHRTILFTVDKTVVEKLSKNAPEPSGVISCGPSGFVQSLHPSRNSEGNVSGFSGICNTIETIRIIENVNVDPAVRTVGQSYLSSRNANQPFRVDVFNLGVAAIPATNISFEFRFDGAAWMLQPFANSTCSAVLAHKGPVDRIVVGERCTLSAIDLPGKGGVVQANFILEPLGPDTTRPATSTPQPIFSVKAGIINEQLDGADANPANEMAAFPLILER